MKPTQTLSPVPRFIAVRVVPAVVIVASAFFTYIGVENTRLARESLDWPSVQGEILQSGIDEQIDRTTTTGRGGRTYQPVIRYRYRVGGTDFEGQRVALGEYATADRADAEVVVQRYPVGGRVPVHHRPDAPATAVLEVGSHGLPWLYTALVFLMVGGLLAWLAPKLIVPR
jgi:hypothetical protein